MTKTFEATDPSNPHHKQVKYGLIAAGIGLMSFAVYIYVGYAVGKAYQAPLSRGRILHIMERLEIYRRWCGQYPTTKQGLEALISQPVTDPKCKSYPVEALLPPFDSNFNDTWNRPLTFISDGNSFTLVSLGRDGKEGGIDEDTDIKGSSQK